MAEVTIERLGHLGDGIAPGPIFVPRTLPGEVVEGALDGDRISDPRILRPVADRVCAPCVHYKTCGGCALLHASDDFVAEWKVNSVAAALQARNLPTPIRTVHTSPAQSRRRVTFSGRRTKSGATVGFHERRGETIVRVPGCIVIRPAIAGVIPTLEQLTAMGASRKGEMKFAVTETETGLDVSVSGGKELTLQLRQEIVRIAEDADLARLTWSDEPVVERRLPTVTIGRARAPLPPGAFLQATREGEIALQLAVSAALEDAAGPVVDLFSGLGTFALQIAARREVHAVEASPGLISALDSGWRHSAGLRRITTEIRDLFRRPLLPNELDRFAAVVIDPPRAGAQAQAATIGRSAIKRVAAVSCNPVTFARDAALLISAGFTLNRIDVIDQFRWSPHIEIAAQFSR